MTPQYIMLKNRYQQKIMVDPNDFQAKAIQKNGLYDKTGLFFIEKLLAKLHDPVAFDIGANVGHHALRLAVHCRKVYLFEPQKLLLKYLQTTQDLNQIKNWHIFNIGLGDEEKSLPLYTNVVSNCETSFVEALKADQHHQEFATVRIGDEVVKENNINQLDFIKIDVEGFEAKVIMGLRHSISQFKPIIFMEWDKEVTKEEFKTHRLFEELFSSYIVRAIIRNPERQSFGKKVAALFRGRLLAKRIIGDFDPQKNYRHIVLVPKEKVDLLTD